MVRSIVREKAGAPRQAATGQGISASAPRVTTDAPLRARTLPVGEDGDGQRLDNFLVKQLKGVPKTHVYRIIRSGEVRVNRGRAAADTRLAAGDAVRVPPLRLPDASTATARPVPAREFPLIHEDDWLIAVDKPAGVAVHGGSGVSHGVIEQLRTARPTAKFLELVHRLDRETSGVLLIAKKRSALLALQDQFRKRAVAKTYAALVAGQWPAARQVIDVALHKYLTDSGERRVRTVAADHADGRRAITLVERVAQYADYALLDVTIKTGRTHQIRVHLAHTGHAIVGDDKYGDFALNKALAAGQLAQLKFDRMFLHARRLGCTHPGSGQPLELTAPLPAQCQTLLDNL